MQLAIYAHPFDLEALRPLGGLQRLRDLGFTEIALATSYHDGRWLQPWNPVRRVRFLEDGAVHFRPVADYGVLRPQISSEVPARGPSPLERLSAEGPPLGLRVRAWSVLTHNSRLGALHPELCVENAFGDRYSYALCPAQPAVQQYIAAMTKDLGAHAGLSSIEFEALGQMGHKHSSHHDKASWQPSGLLDAALSACFCSCCAASMRDHGAVPAAVRTAVRAFVDRHLDQADALAPAPVPSGPADLGSEATETAWLDVVLATRARTVRRLADLVRAVSHKAHAVQVHPHPWFTGSQLSAASAAAFRPEDERVLTCYGEGADAIGRLLTGAAPLALHTSPRRLAIWPKAPQFCTDEDLMKVRDMLAAHGIAALAIYHLGLLPWRTIERVAKILRA